MIEITSAGSYFNETYTSKANSQCALLISTLGNITLTNPTVIKSGGPTDADDNYNFYGINSGILIKDDGITSIVGGTTTTNSASANGVFSYGVNGEQNGVGGTGRQVTSKMLQSPLL